MNEDAGKTDPFEDFARRDLEAKGVAPEKAREVVEDTYGEEEVEHTPGPWKVTDTHHRDIVAENQGEGNGWYEIALDVDSEANARLMAAAPELLEAAKEATEKLEAHIRYLESRGRIQAFPDVVKPLRTAIAKAEGAP